MNSNNIVSFPELNHSNEFSITPGEIKDVDQSISKLKKSYCDIQANELFKIIMRMLEQSGAMDSLSTEDEDQFEDFQPRLIMLKEVLYSIYCFFENIDYELDEVFHTMFKPLGVGGDEFSTELYATFDTKYKDKLIEMTKQYIKDENG
ncbi:MAG TPA: hypothetical protein DCX27_03560 [Balneola sp.]|nr:hypothetical protein [Balneola sp.]|tara:strand:- start:2586 stop:3029 length:444 start_codon:yes stop_codon:yes gene_type:complete